MHRHRRLLEHGAGDALPAGRDDAPDREEGHGLSVPGVPAPHRLSNDDGARLRVGGQLLVNDWANGPARTNTTAAVTLVAGQRYPVTVEFFDSAGGGEIRLRWRKPSDGGFSAVPASALRPGAVDWPAGLLPRERVEFGYDAEGRRFMKRRSIWNGTAYALASETRFLHDRWNLIAEVTWNSTSSTYDLHRSHVWGTDLSGSFQGAGGVGGLLFSTLQLQPSPSTHAPAFDGNGNVIAYVDTATGAVSATYEYDPFGGTIVADGPQAEEMPFRFSTKYTDRESGLLYYGFRYYSPNTGRWLSRDPIEENGGLNLYGIVGNNPINLFDPLGLNAACAALAADIAVQAGKLAAEFLKYDPVADARGGHIRGGTRQVGGRSYPNRTKPGGHYKEMMDLKRGLWNRLNEFKEKCWDDDDCDAPPKIPVWVWDVAKRPIPAPVAPLNPFQQWTVNVPEESIPTPGEVFVYGAGGAAIGIGVAVGAPLVVAGGGLLGLTPAYQ